MKRLQRHKFPFNNVLSLSTMFKITWKFFKKVAWSQFREGQALRRKGNKVEVLEGEFRTFTYMSHV